MNPVPDANVGERFWQPMNVQDASKALGDQEKIDAKTKAAKDLATHAAALKVPVPKPGKTEPEPAGPGGANNAPEN